MAKGFVAVNVTPQARDSLRDLSFFLTGRAGKRVSMSSALLAAIEVADQHPEATAHALERYEASSQKGENR